jgi:hypothetical protein
VLGNSRRAKASSCGSDDVRKRREHMFADRQGNERPRRKGIDGAEQRDRVD